MTEVPQDEKPFLRRFVYPTLTKLSHGTAPFITTFVLIHLSAPVLANLGGSSLASQVMVRPSHVESRMSFKCAKI